MKSGDIVNHVKFVVGDYTLKDSDTDFETLIVKGGNLTIDSKTTPSGLRGIIVLRDDDRK